MAEEPKLKVKMLRIGRFAGPSVFEPQFETTFNGEVVEVSPNFAAYLVSCGNGEICTGEPKAKAPAETETKPRGILERLSGSKPPTADKVAAETKS